MIGGIELWDPAHVALAADLLKAFLLGLRARRHPGRAHLADHVQLCDRRLFDLARACAPG